MTANVCSTDGDSGSCSSWSPASEVSLVSGVRYIDDAWLQSVINNPAPLWTCDDAYLAPRSTTGFTVNSASTGELLYVLGLRDNDIPLTLNGMELDNYWEGLSAFLVLWIENGTTTYDLAVKRGSSTIHFYYTLT